MRLRSRQGRIRHRPPRQAGLDSFTALAFEELERPPPHLAKDLLGAAATLAIIAAILVQVTSFLAAPCRAHLNPKARPGACSGISAIADHARGIVIWGAAACAALAAVAFVWYMFWGYKANEHIGASRETRDSQR